MSTLLDGETSESGERHLFVSIFLDRIDSGKVSIGRGNLPLMWTAPPAPGGPHEKEKPREKAALAGLPSRLPDERVSIALLVCRHQALVSLAFQIGPIPVTPREALELVSD